MANNPYVNKVQLANGTTLIDLSTDTAVASDVAQGKYFHLPTGERVQGTATGGSIVISDTTDAAGGTIRTITASDVTTLKSKSITANGTYNPSTDSADGYSEVIVAIPSGTAGTPSATKGTVSNHSVTVTPSVTNVGGIISSGTITGTAVTVTASELESGTLSITENGTGISVSGYSAVDVNVSGGGGTSWETIYSGAVYVDDWGDDINYATVSGYFNTHDDFEYNKKYRITWINDQYECVATELLPSIGDGYAVGNAELFGGETGNNEPFCMIRAYQGVNLLIGTTSSTGSKTLVIEKQVSGGGGGSTLITKTISANGVYDPADDDADGYSEVTVALPSGTEGTPTATKGTVSNHSVSVTPSVTNTAGVITGGTRTGTAVTVTASELASGNKEIVSNGSNIDVVGYSTVSVAVPSGSSKALYTYLGLASRTANSYGATNAKVTVAKAGTYNISYVAIRGSSTGTMGTNLHIGNTEKGNQQTWNNGTYGQYVTYSNQSISANTDVTIYATSGNASRTVYCGQLIVQEV